jgi:hypothetical protein
MKVIYNVENRMIQEVQQSMESQLIEVMNLKMQMIQFGLIVKGFRMKYRKLKCRT